MTSPIIGHVTIYRCRCHEEPECEADEPVDMAIDEEVAFDYVPGCEPVLRGEPGRNLPGEAEEWIPWDAAPVKLERLLASEVEMALRNAMRRRG